MGRGVKNMPLAKANSTMAKANAEKLSAFSLPFQSKPSISLQEASIPLQEKSILFSIPTKRLSKIIIGSATKKIDEANAIRLRALHR